ncbi:DUF2946 family protein [Lysobacter ciconiae]|uniref:DUF2946 family protein n=1 Tax=Novilysobacter ciconiae TaxID=2781022 RepID=A0A7S6ZRN7_9GAMM|nr:DUF2946 family protein [Lysobacter ciconiae]QOW18920.1 DUF2946 family protein [Lysobacter ciconiae]
MNSRPLHRWMRHLALAATLALALVPSLGRLAGQPAMPMHTMPAAAAARASSGVMGDAAHASHSGETRGPENPLVTAHGHASTLDAGDRQPPAGNGHHGSDDDCAYCPLLAGTTALPAPGLPAALPMQRDAVRVPAIRTPTLDRHPTGLGSRGPPITA